MYTSAALILVASVPSLWIHAAPIDPPVDPDAAPQSVNGDSNPFTFPLTNGFPDLQGPDNPNVTDIEANALGTLPNDAPPPSLADDDATSLQLIAFNELWEVAFFTEFLFNVTNNVTGYEISDASSRQSIINALTAVQAQEQLHVLVSNNVLAYFNLTTVEPCQYMSPVTNLSQAFNLARTFTDVVLGTLANVQTHLAQNGDIDMIATIGSVIGQEGEQNGFYRYSLDLIPSSLPFLTASARAFAFSALNQMFVVPGSCPNAYAIDLPIFLPLNVVTSPVEAVDQNLTFSLQSDTYQSADGLSVVFINQQNVPVVGNITDAAFSDGALQFSADFPYTEYEMNGLTIVAVTNSTGPFDNAEAVANATVAGPGLIEIN